MGPADPDAELPAGISEYGSRIRFHAALEVMEVDLSDLHLASSAEVNALYDIIEQRIVATGEEYWFFLINYSGSRIDPAAWFAFARRGKMLNVSHSMGTVRCDASEETRRQIERDAGTENFDANLFSDRDNALEWLKSQPSTRRRKIVHRPSYTLADFESRVIFLSEGEIMDIDLSGLRLRHGRDVDDLIDYLERRIEETGRRWYFLINYSDCRIEPAAWIQWARRGKELNLGGSLGTVRYETGEQIMLTSGFAPSRRDFTPTYVVTGRKRCQGSANFVQRCDSVGTAIPKSISRTSAAGPESRTAEPGVPRYRTEERRFRRKKVAVRIPVRIRDVARCGARRP